MKVLQMNAVCGKGSTGKICVDISKMLSDNQIENYILYSVGESDYKYGIKCAGSLSRKFQALKSKLFGNYGFNSKKNTKNIIRKIKEINPDIVHLHNIHSHDVNLSLLFEYLKREKKKVFWTFHDCWAFTGYCPHFDMVHCDKWKIQCSNCPQKRKYSWFFDKSQKLYNKKKTLFSGLNLTIITPSKWLGEIVKQSFLKDYDIKVINNGIDLEIFKPTDSDFKEKYGLKDKKIILGVAFGWGSRKGLDIFINLSSRLPKNYQIVLVGTNGEIDKKLPNNIISIHRTENQTELAKIYTSADVFVNPTREENYPTVNMEAIACGTPVVTFKTGGSPEIIDEKTGIVVDIDDIDSLEKAIVEITNTNKFTKESCLEKSKYFKKEDKFKEYIDLYLN